MYIGKQPAVAALTASDITDGIISSAKIADGAIVNADVNASAAIAATKFGAGAVLQVVNAAHASSASSSSSTYADSGLTASITPSSSSNKVLVIATLNGIQTRDNRTWLNAKLLRGASDIVANFTQRAGYLQKYGGTASDYHRGVGGAVCCYLDSPSTTSSTAYKVQIASNDNVASAQICSDSAPSHMTLLEIAG